MLKRILFPCDSSEHSLKAAQYVVELARSINDVEIFLINVTDVPNNVLGAMEGEMTPRSFEQTYSDNSMEVLGKLKNYLNMQGITNIKTLCKFGNPATVICEVAKYENIDLIVMGSRGLGTFRGLFLGSVSNKVTHLAECPVLVVK